MKGVNGKRDRKSLFDLVTHPDRPVMRTLALLGGIAGVLGLVTTVLTLRTSDDETVKTGAASDAARSGAEGGASAGGKERSPLEEVAALSTGVQIHKFVDLLGEPDRKRDVLDAQFKPSNHSESIWQRPSYVLQAVTDSKETVVLYTVTTMDKNFHPEVPFRVGKDRSPLR